MKERSQAHGDRWKLHKISNSKGRQVKSFEQIETRFTSQFLWSEIQTDSDSSKVLRALYRWNLWSWLNIGWLALRVINQRVFFFAGEERTDAHPHRSRRGKQQDQLVSIKKKKIKFSSFLLDSLRCWIFRNGAVQVWGRGRLRKSENCTLWLRIME